METAVDVERRFQWLLTMARNPGSKEHAWWRAKQLQATGEPEYAQFPERLAREMKQEPARE